MRLTKAGQFDRRIMIQTVVERRDAAGDLIPDQWVDSFKLWARRVPRSGGFAAGTELPTPDGVIRQFDLTFQVRDGLKSQSIAPETNRVLYKRRVYEIIGALPGKDREDVLDLLVAARPDHRGSRGLEGVSGQP